VAITHPMDARIAARPANRAVGIWLLACCAMIFLMVVIGGVTRLTESGLSITEWKPVAGVVPPITEHQWADEFERYRQIPQYRAIHPDMTLAEFKASVSEQTPPSDLVAPVSANARAREPTSTTITSSGATCWSNTRSSVAPSERAASFVSIITDARNTMPPPEGRRYPGSETQPSRSVNDQ